MSALDGFLTGFFGKVNQIADERRSTADDYYNKQLERARTVGLTKFQERRQNAQAASDIAQRLVSQAKMPANIAREIAKGGLESLQNAEQVWQSNAELQPDENFWSDVYGIAKDNSALTGQDLSTSIREAYGLGNNTPAKQDSPESTNEESVKDKFNRLFFGSGEMDRAMDRLSTTEVADGMTANQLLQATQEPTFKSTAGPNFTVLAQKEAKAKADLAANKEMKLTADGIKSYMDTFEKKVEDNKNKAINEAGGTAVDMTPEELTALDNRMRRQSAVEMVRDMGPVAQQVPGISLWLQEDSPETEIEEPQTTQTPSVVTEIPEGIMPAFNARGHGTVKFKEYRPDTGQVIYQSSDGKVFNMPFDRVTSGSYGNEAPSTPNEANTLLRINEALKTNNESSFYIDSGEQPPLMITSPKYGMMNFMGVFDGKAVYVPDPNGQFSGSVSIRIPIK